MLANFALSGTNTVPKALLDVLQLAVEHPVPSLLLLGCGFLLAFLFKKGAGATQTQMVFIGEPPRMGRGGREPKD